MATNIQVLGRVFTLLDVLKGAGDDTLTLLEIGIRSGLHRATCHRILEDLMTGGFVLRPSRGEYCLAKVNSPLNAWLQNTLATAKNNNPDATDLVLSIETLETLLKEEQ
jgi:DNA-binding IclR family transcriptional regulator